MLTHHMEETYLATYQLSVKGLYDDISAFSKVKKL